MLPIIALQSRHQGLRAVDSNGTQYKLKQIELKRRPSEAAAAEDVAEAVAVDVAGYALVCVPKHFLLSPRGLGQLSPVLIKI